MTLEEAKDILSRLFFDDYEWAVHTEQGYCESGDEVARGVIEAIEIVLKALEEEKEKNKKLEEEVKCFRDSYEEARIEECDTYFMLNRIINLMAEDIKNNVDILFHTDKNIKDIKAYYFNKVKEK